MGSVGPVMICKIFAFSAFCAFGVATPVSVEHLIKSVTLSLLDYWQQISQRNDTVKKIYSYHDDNPGIL